MRDWTKEDMMDVMAFLDVGWMGAVGSVSTGLCLCVVPPDQLRCSPL